MMTTKKLHILLIEDNPGDAMLIEVMLVESSLPFSLDHATFLYEGIERLGQVDYDVVLLDIGLPDSAGLDAIVEVINKSPGTPVVMLTGLDDEEAAISALRMGAQDYLVKGRINSGALLRSIRYAVERKRMEENLWSSRQFIQSVTEATPNIIYVFDLVSSRVVYVNHTLRDMLGYDIEDIEDMGPHLYERLLHPEEILHLPELLKRYETAGDGAIIETELRMKHANGQWLWLNTRDVVFTRDSEGRPLRILGTAQDITERKYMEDAVRHFAYHDSLTNLPNRRLLTDHIRLALTQASREGHKAAVLCMDLDNFKEVNDSFGHEAGDCVLREVARRLKACLRESDTVARTGGDEFVVVLHKTAHEEDAAIIAEKIISSLREPFIISGEHSLNCTSSVGISLYPIDGNDSETLLRNADCAMYKAKEKGKNHFQFYASAMNDRAMERKKLEVLLREAYEKGEFVLHYQPQVKLRSRLVTCVEALMRWQKPVDGLQFPGQFIPLAEETGLITELDEWALRSACRQNKAWQDAGHRPLCVTVNLSARHIRQPQIVETVSRVLNETGLDPVYLGLEISECPAVKDIDALASILMRLEALGVQIFIDDFGKGSASISHLLKWPLRTVKIDKSYIDNLGSDPDYGSVVRSLIDMAHQLDINVVAEGVETEGQLAFLQAAMCDDIQGYYFSRPLPAEEFVKFINQ